MKQKFSALLLISLFFIGCASVPKLPADTKFAVKSMKINLKYKLQVEGYPAQSEFSEIVKKNMMESLKEANLLADSGQSSTMSITIDIDYTRQFAGEDTPIPSKSVIAPLLKYTVVVYNKETETNRIVKSGTINRGMLNNLKNVATFGLGNDIKDELSDIKKMTNSIAADLNSLK